MKRKEDFIGIESLEAARVPFKKNVFNSTATTLGAYSIIKLVICSFNDICILPKADLIRLVMLVSILIFYLLFAKFKRGFIWNSYFLTVLLVGLGFFELLISFDNLEECVEKTIYFILVMPFINLRWKGTFLLWILALVLLCTKGYLLLTPGAIAFIILTSLNVLLISRWNEHLIKSYFKKISDTDKQIEGLKNLLQNEIEIPILIVSSNDLKPNDILINFANTASFKALDLPYHQHSYEHIRQSLSKMAIYPDRSNVSLGEENFSNFIEFLTKVTTRIEHSEKKKQPFENYFNIEEEMGLEIVWESELNTSIVEKKEFALVNLDPTSKVRKIKLKLSTIFWEGKNNVILIMNEVKDKERTESEGSTKVENLILNGMLEKINVNINLISNSIENHIGCNNEIDKRSLKIPLKASQIIHYFIANSFDILNISKKRLFINSDIFPFSDLIKEVKNLIKLGLKLKEIKLIITYAENLILFADKDKLIQILLNILDISIRYTKSKGTIYVDAKSEDRFHGYCYEFKFNPVLNQKFFFSKKFLRLTIEDEGSGSIFAKGISLDTWKLKSTKNSNYEESTAESSVALSNYLIKKMLPKEMRKEGSLAIINKAGGGTRYEFLIPVYSN